MVLLATTRFLDAAGLIAAGILTDLGVFILPDKRRKAHEEFRENTGALRERLGEVVRRRFAAELNRSIEGVRGHSRPIAAPSAPSTPG